jgi:hypothetical protein
MGPGVIASGKVEPFGVTAPVPNESSTALIVHAFCPTQAVNEAFAETSRAHSGLNVFGETELCEEP